MRTALTIVSEQTISRLNFFFPSFFLSLSLTPTPRPLPSLSLSLSPSVSFFVFNLTLTGDDIYFQMKITLK